MKQLFTEFWEIKDKEEPTSYLVYWCHIVDEAVTQRFIKAQTLLEDIERYHKLHKEYHKQWNT